MAGQLASMLASGLLDSIYNPNDNGDVFFNKQTGKYEDANGNETTLYAKPNWFERVVSPTAREYNQLNAQASRSGAVSQKAAYESELARELGEEQRGQKVYDASQNFDEANPTPAQLTYLLNNNASNASDVGKSLTSAKLRTGKKQAETESVQADIDSNVTNLAKITGLGEAKIKAAIAAAQLQEVKDRAAATLVQPQTDVERANLVNQKTQADITRGALAAENDPVATQIRQKLIGANLARELNDATHFNTAPYNSTLDYQNGSNIPSRVLYSNPLNSPPARQDVNAELQRRAYANMMKSISGSGIRGGNSVNILPVDSSSTNSPVPVKADTAPVTITPTERGTISSGNTIPSGNGDDLGLTKEQIIANLLKAAANRNPTGTSTNIYDILSGIKSNMD